MAIDDDTTYGLTGAQVKDIVSNIKSAQSSLGDIDDNYPTSSPNGVALWLLPPGVYHAPKDKSVYVATNNKITVSSDDGELFLVFRDSASATYTTIIYGGAQQNHGNRGTKLAMVQTSSGSPSYDGYIMTSGNLTNSLGRNMGGSYIGFSYQAPDTTLMAKALNSISTSQTAPTSTTQAAVGHIMAVYDPNDPTVGHLYMCTAQDYVNNNWTWIQLL